MITPRSQPHFSDRFCRREELKKEATDSRTESQITDRMTKITPFMNVPWILQFLLRSCLLTMSQTTKPGLRSRPSSHLGARLQAKTWDQIITTEKTYGEINIAGQPDLTFSELCFRLDQKPERNRMIYTLTLFKQGPQHGPGSITALLVDRMYPGLGL